eukprot:m.109383 g.109383  ORF g.109383 m.109383 type:complete len:1075 (+) comp27952_c0_seq2:248-3472(+)
MESQPPQPQPELKPNSNTVVDDDTVLDTNTTEFTINQFREYRLSNNTAFIETPSISVLGFGFKLVCYPVGQSDPTQMSLYLQRSCGGEVSPASDSKAFVHFTFFGVNDKGRKIVNHASRCFKPHEDSNWGFKNFMDESGCRDCMKANGSITLKVKMRLVEGSDVETWGLDANYDSKQKTGMVGISNQGATCYMNSLLQTLFFTGDLRRGVFLMPTVPTSDTPEYAELLEQLERDKESNVALAVQRVFYRLHESDSAVETKELTRSFGWGFAEAFKQHDVQEFLRVLMDNLEEKMKGKKIVDGLVQRLFMAKMKSYIKCTNVDFESSRVEDYYDVQLKVKGVKSLLESFKDYCSVETLDGDNKYQAEGHGLQDAKKGIIFETFPKVLYLQLRRVEYDMELDESVKVNDRFEFPLEMNLNEFLEKQDVNEPANYTLHSVLTQMGSVQYGHYVAYIRPDLQDQWYKFDDENVIKCSAYEAIDQNFGGPIDGTNRLSHSSAYMLVYVRTEPDLHTTYARNVNEIPPHLHEYFQTEEVEAERKSAEACERAKFFSLQVVQARDVIGECIPDIISKKEDRFQTIELPRDSSTSDVYDAVAKNTNRELSTFRLHNFIDRRNKTFRPEKVLATDQVETWSKDSFMFCQDIADTVIPIKADSGDTEMEDVADSHHILLVLKKFTFANETLEIFAVVSVPASMSLRELIPFVCERGQFADGDKLQCFEELTPKKTTLLDKDLSLTEHELEDGDILLWEETPQHPSRSVKEYYLKLWNTHAVTFKPVDPEVAKDETKTLELEMDLRSTYFEVVERLSIELNWEDAQKIQLTMHSFFDDSADVSKRIASDAATMYEMLNHNGWPQDKIIYYEQLSVTISEIESKVYLSDLSVLNFDDFTLTPRPSLVPPDATVADIIRETITTDQAPATDVTQYRLLQMVSDHVIHSIENPNTEAKDLRHFKLRLERIPQGQMQANSGYLIQCQHVFKVPGKRHGVPFFFNVQDGETLGQIASRLQAFLKVEDSEFEKWTISLELDNRTTITDSDTDFVITPDLMGHPDCRILLDHKQQHYKRYKRTFESAIKIHN